MVDRRRPEEGEGKLRGRELLEDPGEALMIRHRINNQELRMWNRAIYITRPSSDSLDLTYCVKFLGEGRS